jgi:hypothetical protein
LEIILNISEMEGLVIDELLPVAGERNDYVSWYLDGWRRSHEECLVKLFGRDMHSSVADCRLAKVFLTKSLTADG